MERAEILKATVDHWQEMIDIVSGFNEDEMMEKPNTFDFQLKYNTSWGGEFCPLCNFFYWPIDCSGCPLAKVSKCISRIADKFSLWEEVFNSKTYTEWLINAKIFIEVIKTVK